MGTRIVDGRLAWSRDSEIVVIEAWGRDGLRVRASANGRIDEDRDWAHMLLRECLKPYIKLQMAAAHLRGSPVMRPLFYDFPEEKRAWEVQDQYMFGPDILVAPVMHPGMRERSVYLPGGAGWRNLRTGERAEGGIEAIVDSPLSSIPVFVREGSAPLRPDGAGGIELAAGARSR